MTVTSRDIAQPGLRWTEALLGSEPEWTVEPSLDVIRKLAIQHLELENETSDSYNIQSFAEGAFNKLYAITCSKGDYIFRVTLPVAPAVKTQSEVATLAFVRERTSIPVPGIIHFDSDLNNELGFEWLLMERLDGQPLVKKWHHLSWLQKGLLVMQIADFVAQLSRNQLQGIGSLYFAEPLSNDAAHVATNPAFQLGETVHINFFNGDHIQLPIPRGPFKNSHDMLSANIDHLQHDITKTLASTDEDDQQDGADMQDAFNALSNVIPRLFPPSATNEPTFLFHHDLSLNNILVNDAGTIVGIVDWESTIAAPSWLAFRLPQFLTGGPRQCPELPEDDDAETQEDYLDDVLEYEAAQLRRFFLEEMGRIEPGWVEVFRRESTRRDVLLAIDNVSVGWCVKQVIGWAGVVNEGREPRVSLTGLDRGAVV